MELDIPVLIGTLNISYGIKGFEIVDVGHPVFELKDRYLFYLNNIRDPKLVVAIPFYKDSLRSSINFTVG